MMFVSEIAPDLVWAFAGGFVITTVLAAWLTKGREHRGRILFTLGTSLVGGLVASGLLTVIALAIDDWSACRLAPVVSLFYGYPLYSTPDTPANGFAYGPVGAWVYLPAAAVAFFTSSATIGLLTGQFQAFVFMWIPVLLLYKARPEDGDRRVLLVLSLCMLAFMVGTAPLRYVSFSVHVDAAALCFAALAIWFSARAVSGTWISSFASGVFIGLAVMAKQTMLPIGGVCFVLLILCGWRVLWFSALGFAATVFSVIGVIILTGAADGMVGMYLKFFTGLPRALTLVQSAQILAPNLLLQIIVFICIAVALGLRVPSMATLTAKLRTDAASRFIFGLWFAGSGYALIGIYTGAAYAADSNHYAPAMYFVLLATVAVGVNSRIPLSHPIRRSAILVAACWVAASPVFFFLPRFPGWYLYQNNFLEHAYQYSKSHPGEAYFPWQPLSVLLAEGRLYHLGEQLFYEDHLGMPLRKPAQYLAHLPAEAEFIAVRPFGAPASVLPMLFPDVQSGGEVDGLPGWQVYRFTDDRLHVTLPK